MDWSHVIEFPTLPSLGEGQGRGRQGACPRATRKQCSAAVVARSDGSLNSASPVEMSGPPQALLTMLHRSTDCLCRAGAPM